MRANRGLRQLSNRLKEEVPCVFPELPSFDPNYYQPEPALRDRGAYSLLPPIPAGARRSFDRQDCVKSLAMHCPNRREVSARRLANVPSMAGQSLSRQPLTFKQRRIPHASPPNERCARRNCVGTTSCPRAGCQRACALRHGCSTVGKCAVHPEQGGTVLTDLPHWQCAGVRGLCRAGHLVLLVVDWHQCHAQQGRDCWVPCSRRVSMLA